VNVKKSKLQRKYVRAMDQLADVPRPARRFKYPPTLNAAPTTRTCTQLVDVKWKRARFRLKAAKPEWRICSTPLVLVPFKRRLECPACRLRGKLKRADARLVRSARTQGVFARARASEPWSVAKAARGRFGWAK
jgi:hypothetical protein